jgi:hypothetical protein
LNNDPAWLESRLNLFREYCAPTIRDQTATGFRWLIYFDTGTPEAFISRVRAELAGIPQAELVFIDAFDRELWLPPIHAALDPDAELVITTRLDNDDGLHPDFLERVQSAAVKATVPSFLNLRRGYTVSGGRLYQLSDLSNAFLSLVEQRESLETVWVKPHTEAASFAPVLQVDAAPAWLQVVHGENVSNRVRGRRVAARHLHDFGIPNAGSEESSFAIFADNISRYPGRFARETAATVFRRVRRLTS